MKFYQFILWGLIFCSFNAYAQEDTTYIRGDFLIEASDTTKIDFIIKGTPQRKTISKGDTLFENGKYLILGNDDKTAILGVYKKCKSKYEFREFPISVYKGKLAAPNFKTDMRAYLFRTQIRDQCKKKGVNFAGHYTIVEWGCGSDCQTIAIADRLNGKIYYSHIFKINSLFYGLQYRPNSQMMIINSGLLENHKGYVRCTSYGGVENV
jgi:hypothetical protein